MRGPDIDISYAEIYECIFAVIQYGGTAHGTKFSALESTASNSWNKAARSADVHGVDTSV